VGPKSQFLCIPSTDPLVNLQIRCTEALAERYRFYGRVIEGEFKAPNSETNLRSIYKEGAAVY
jgi:hypothetical protein